jgi:hypothetical protein
MSGESYDLFEQVDNTGSLDYFLTSCTINSSSSIVDLARYGGLPVGSYVPTPIGDHMFSDGLIRRLVTRFPLSEMPTMDDLRAGLAVWSRWVKLPHSCDAVRLSSPARGRCVL